MRLSTQSSALLHVIGLVVWQKHVKLSHFVCSLYIDMLIISVLSGVCPIVRLVSRFRRGCHGLQIDVDRRVEGVDMDISYLDCNSLGYVEDEQHLIFDCPAYNHIRVKHVNLSSCTAADFLSLCELNACGLQGECCAYRKETLSV